MKQAMISRGGQISIPAEVRHRWQTSRLSLEDRGTELILRPIPSDPIGAAIGSLAGPGPSTDEARASLRAEELRAGARQRAGDRRRRT
jgi:bifunctional DNA-binding transcriptional regulator/antitoxin component of YhaV-PrlF toxin-antitoxin module